MTMQWRKLQTPLCGSKTNNWYVSILDTKFTRNLSHPKWPNNYRGREKLKMCNEDAIHWQSRHFPVTWLWIHENFVRSTIKILRLLYHRKRMRIVFTRSRGPIISPEMRRFSLSLCPTLEWILYEINFCVDSSRQTIRETEKKWWSRSEMRIRKSDCLEKMRSWEKIR